MADKFMNLKLSSFVKKVIIGIICVVLISVIAFGIFQHKQYQKDIEPYETTTNWHGKDVLLKATYDVQDNEVKLSMIHKGIIIEQWQFDALHALDITYKLTDSDKNYTFTFLNAEAYIANPLVLNFKVNNIKTPKEFMRFKERLSNIHLLREMPMLLNENEEVRLEGKNQWLQWKKEKEAKEEAERKQREWQENILSNCVYKSSDGICFTTKIVHAPLVFEGIKTQSWDSAKDYCESKGYKLPSDNDLRSLFRDILGVEINAGINVKTVKSSYSDIPTNYQILKEIKPEGNWDNICLWEDTKLDETKPYYRCKKKTFGDDETYQSFMEYASYYDTICVYNPNGKPYKSLAEKQQEQRAKEEQEKQRQEENFRNDAENGLF